MALKEMLQTGLPAIQNLTDIALSIQNDTLTDYNADHDLLDSPIVLSEFVSFVRKSFKRKVCSNFIPCESIEIPEAPPGESSSSRADSQESGAEEMIRCVCGELRKNHDPNYVSMFQDGELNIFVEELKPTNAFGRIVFYPKSLSYRKPAEYVRLLDCTEPSTVLQLMCNHWLMTQPNPPSLVVSVAAAGDLYSLSDSKTRDIFNRGLVKAIRATNGWLITNGLNSGVAKAVGAAVQEGQSLAWKDTTDLNKAASLHCIGIATWNQVQHRDILTNKNVNTPHTAEYYVDQVTRDGLEEPLNPNHSHFLIVDTGVSSDGYANIGAAEFRAALEHQIAAPKDEGGLDVPVVCLLVEGNLVSLQQLLNSVRQGLPAVVCENSGRASELIGWTLRQTRRLSVYSMDDLQNDQEEYQLRLNVMAKAKEFESDDCTPELYYDQIADLVMEICTYKDQITLFQIGPNSSLDEALLLSILDSQHKRNPWKQLELAQSWNRADVASKILCNPKFSILATRKNVCKLMLKLTDSIVNNQPNFVKLYIDSGLPLKEYLTVGTLCEIYKRTAREAPYLWSRLHILPKKPYSSTRKDMDVNLEFCELKNMTLDNVNMLIHSFGRRFSQPEYQQSSLGHFNSPLQELFYWAVMFNRQELALLFWEKAQSPLITTIAGTVLCDSLANGEAYISLRQQFAEFKDKLEDLAVGLINEAFKQNIKKASLLIQRSSAVWGRLSCMQLAGLVSNQRFLSTECCQSVIKKDWKRGFNASVWEILISTFTFFPIFWWIKFEKHLPNHCRCPPGDCTCRRIPPKTEVNQPKSSIVTIKQFSNQGPRVGKSFNYSHNPEATTGEMQPLHSVDCPDNLKSNYHKDDQALTRRQYIAQLSRIWMWRIFTFYYSPVVKFINHTVWYSLYLLLYTYVLLFCVGHSGKVESITWPEYFLYFWQLTFIMEEIRIILWQPRKALYDKLADYWLYATLQSWNRLHMVGYSISLVVMCMRFLSEQAFAITKILLIINFIVYVLRIFKVYFINGYLGPKVVMINRMAKDLMMFFLVFAVSLISFSITYHSLYYSKGHFDLALIPHILTTGIWEIFGEVDLSFETETNESYCQEQKNNGYFFTECQLRQAPLTLILAIYLFFSNILLVNMLIATFTHIFEDIHKNSQQIWMFEMYFLIDEFRAKPLLAEPFIIFEHLFLVVRSLKHRVKKNPTRINTDEIIGGKPLSKPERHFLSVFESVCRADLVENRMNRCACTCGHCCKCGKKSR